MLRARVHNGRQHRVGGLDTNQSERRVNGRITWQRCSALLTQFRGINPQFCLLNCGSVG